MRRPLVLLAACLSLAVSVAACGRDSSSITAGGKVPGGSLTIVSLLPREGPRAEASRAVSSGIKLAIAQAGGSVGEWTLNYSSLDAPDRPGPLAAATQEALRDISLVAVVSDLDGASAAVTAPLLNAAGILQVSPGVAQSVVDDDPLAQPSGARTYASMVPGPAAEAQALARAARGPVAVEAESGDAPAEALAEAVRGRVGRTVATRRAGTVVYTGTDADNALGALEGIAEENRRARLLAPQALWGTDLARRLPAGVRRRLSFTTSVAGPVDPAFRAAFERAYGSRPASPWAQVGWAAANRVIAAARAAGDRANVRLVLNRAFFAADPAAAADRRPFRVVPATSR